MLDSMRKKGCVSPHWLRDGTLRHRARITHEGRSKSLGLFDTIEEAQKEIDLTLACLGETVEGYTVAAWVEKCVAERERVNRESGGTQHRSVEQERSILRCFISTASFARWPLRRLDRPAVVRWVRELLLTKALKVKHSRKTGVTTTTVTDRNLSRSRVRQALSLLSVCLSRAADEGRARLNVADGVDVPKVARDTEGWTYLTSDEIAALLAPKYEALPAKQRAAFTLAIYSGLREGELWGLRWCDVYLDDERPELMVRKSFDGPTKSGKPRPVVLLREAVEAIRAWRAIAPGVGTALVFPGRKGKCHAPSYDAGWPRWRALASVTRRVRFHDLRHTCASHLVMGTWTRRPWRLEEVQLQLGHSSITTTQRYAHLAPDGLHEAARGIEPHDTEMTPAPKKKLDKPRRKGVK